MNKSIEIMHDGMKYEAILHGNEIVFYRVDIDDSGFAAWGTNDDIIYNYSITGDVSRPVALYRKVVKAVRALIYGEKLGYYTFNVSDAKRAAIYNRFAKGLHGYSSVHAGDYFYLYKKVTPSAP